MDSLTGFTGPGDASWSMDVVGTVVKADAEADGADGADGADADADANAVSGANRLLWANDEAMEAIRLSYPALSAGTNRFLKDRRTSLGIHETCGRSGGNENIYPVGAVVLAQIRLASSVFGHYY